MIKGMGIDITEIARIKAMVSEHEDTFVGRIFTAKERGEAALRQERNSYYAGRWAVKEAVSKALGCGIGEKCSWQDIETLNCVGGRPETRLSGRAQQTFKSLGAKYLHVTVSHEASHAVAMVVIE